MKHSSFLLIFLIAFQMHSASQEIVLDSCYMWAKHNYPNLKQAGIRKEITKLQKENVASGSLPRITLNGQATYQSDVTGIDIPLPDISVPQAPRDQYKMYAEIRQTIWDGGISEANIMLEDALLNTHLSELEVELYKLNQQVAQAFFSIKISEKQMEVLEARKTILEENLKNIKSAINHGTAEKTSELVIQAEIINLIQNQVHLESSKSVAIGILSVLTGKKINNDAEFNYNASLSSFNDMLNRPELKLFDANRQQLDNRIKILAKSRNPQVLGFGQAGYGKPGLNMLSNKFDSYYLIGAGISWTPFDWKKTGRQKEVLMLQKDLVTAREQTFRQGINLLLERQQEEIERLEDLLETDKKLVSLRADISKTASSKLQNETITTSEFIREMQSETIARLNYELRKIQISEAREIYQLIQGKN